MGTALATGQPGGVAASLLYLLGYPPQAAKIHRMLMEHSALLEPDQLPLIDEVEDPIGRATQQTQRCSWKKVSQTHPKRVLRNAITLGRRRQHHVFISFI